MQALNLLRAALHLARGHGIVILNDGTMIKFEDYPDSWPGRVVMSGDVQADEIIVRALETAIEIRPAHNDEASPVPVER